MGQLSMCLNMNLQLIRLFVAHDKIIVTPHLGASTVEAKEKIGNFCFK